MRRGELIGDGVTGAPIGDLVAATRAVARAARVRFSGVVVVLPDEDLATAIDEIGKVRGQPVAIVRRSALSTVGTPRAPPGLAELTVDVKFVKRDGR